MYTYIGACIYECVGACMSIGACIPYTNILCRYMYMWILSRVGWGPCK